MLKYYSISYYTYWLLLYIKPGWERESGDGMGVRVLLYWFNGRFRFTALDQYMQNYCAVVKPQSHATLAACACEESVWIWMPCKMGATNQNRRIKRVFCMHIRFTWHKCTCTFILIKATTKQFTIPQRFCIHCCVLHRPSKRRRWEHSICKNRKSLLYRGTHTQPYKRRGCNRVVCNMTQKTIRILSTVFAFFYKFLGFRVPSLFYMEKKFGTSNLSHTSKKKNKHQNYVFCKPIQFKWNYQFPIFHNKNWMKEKSHWKFVEVYSSALCLQCTVALHTLHMYTWIFGYTEY